MKSYIDWHSRDFVTQLSKAPPPGQIRRLAPATAGRKTSLPPQNISQRDARRACVRGFPPRQFPSAHQKIPGDDRPNQASVKHAARTQKIEREKHHRILKILGLSKKH